MGGGGKGGTTTQSVTIPPEVLARYNAVNARAEGLADTPFKPYSNDPNAFVAPLTPTQQAGIANTNMAAGMAQPYYGAAAGMTMAGSQSVGQLTPEQINKYQNPYTQAVADTTFNNLRQQQAQEMQGATGNAIRAGAFGGDRSGLVAANMARQQQMGTAQAMAPIYQQGYQNAVQTAQGQQAVTAADLARLQQGGQQIGGLGSAAQGAALQGAGAQLAAGQTQQQTSQAGKAALYNQFLQEQGYPFQIAQFLANIAMGTGALSGSTTTTEAPGGFFSDERLKENIKKIGETNDGQNIYKYNYKGEPRTQIGLLAQDVEKHHPDAVGKQQGYKTVDYDKATENSEGGAVHQFNAREGFDLGGSAAFDPNMVKELLRRQVEVLGQQGAPGGGKTPGAAGYMPAPTALPANIGLARPAPPPQQQPSGLAQVANTSRGISEGLGMLEGAKGKLFGGTDAKGNPTKGWFSGDSKPEGTDPNAKLTPDQQAAAIKAADDVKKVAVEGAPTPQAHGGLITGPRMGYAAGGLPYGDEEAAKKGYMGQLSYDLPSPAALKGQQDSMRAGKMPDAPQSGLGEAVGAASKLYGGTKMASAAYDKASSMLSGATPAGELASKYPAAPAGTPMPPVRPEGLGGAGAAPAADLPAAGANPIAANMPANTAEGFHIPMGTAPVAEAAPVAEGLGAVAPIAEAAPVAEGLAAAAPIAEGLAAAAPIAEVGAGLAAAAPVAEAGVAAAELLPLLFAFSDERLKENIKKVGETTDGQNIYKYNFKGDPRTQIGLLAQEVAHDHPEAVGKKNGYLTVDYDKATSGREHHADGNAVGETSTPVFDELRRMREKDEAAATAAAAAPAQAPAQAPAAPAAPTKQAGAIDFGHPMAQKIVGRANEYGIKNPDWMVYQAAHESQLNPEAVNKAGGATGLFQFIPSTWKRVGQGQDPKDADANIDAFMRTHLENEKFFDANGIEKTPTNFRLAQYFGPTGAKNVLANPDAPLTKTLPSYVFPTNPNLVKQTGKDAIAEAAAITSGQNFKMPSSRPAAAAEKSGLGAVKESLSDAGNFYSRNREHIIPVIAGLGSMLASNKANLGQALGEGLVGYSTSAADMMKRAADTDLVKATTTAREAETTIGNVFVRNGITLVSYIDPKTGKAVVRKASEYFALPPNEQPSLNPSDYKTLKEAAAKEAKESGGLGAAAPAGTPAAAPAGTPAPATGLAPTAPPSLTGTMVIEPNAAAKAAAAQEVKDLESIDIGANRDVLIKQNLEILNDAKNRQANAIEMTQGLVDITKPLVTLAAGQQIAPGAYAKVLGTIADKFNGVVRQSGLPESFTIGANAVDQLQMADKASAVLREAKARGMDQRALGALEALERGLADPSKTKEAAAEILAGSYIDKQRMLEEAIYTQKYGQGQGMTVAKNAPLAFKEQYPDASYNRDKVALKDLMLQSIDGEPLLNYALGIGKNKELQKRMDESGVINQKYGTNVVRYFNNSVK
jgi:hypothetical protein